MQKEKANSQNNEKKKVDVCGENGAAEKGQMLYVYGALLGWFHVYRMDGES